MIFTRKEKPIPLLKERGILFEDCLKNCFRFQRVCFTLNNKLTPFPSGEGWGEASGWGEAPPSSPPVFYAVFVGIDGLGYQFYQIEIIKVLWITTEKHNLYPVFLIRTHMSPIDNVPVL